MNGHRFPMFAIPGRVSMVMACLLTGVAAWTGGVGILDRALFDLVARAGTVARGDRGVDARVVAVTMAHGVSPARFIEVARASRAAGAREVVLLADPDSARMLVAMKNDGRLAPEIVVALSGPGVEWDVAGASVAVSPFVGVDGVERRVHSEGGGGPSLAAVVAGKIGHSVPEGSRRFYLRHAAGAIPVVDGERLLGPAGAPRSLLSGKVVLVGSEDVSGARIVTYRHRGVEALAPLAYRAAVLDAVLSDNLIRELPPLGRWLIAGGLGVMAAFACMRLRRFRPLGVAAVTSAAILTVAWLALHGWRIWPAPSESMAACLVTAGVFGFARARAERLGVESVLRRMSAEAERHVDVRAFLLADSPWPMVRSALEAAFDGRPVLLVRIAGDGRGLEPALQEMREALVEIHGGRLPTVEEPPFVHARTTPGRVVEGAAHWGVVAVAGECGLHGFWLVPPSQGEVGSEPARTEEFIRHLGRLLDERVHWRRRLHRPSSEGSPSLASLHERLGGAIRLLEESRQLLVDTVSTTREACFVFDAFGAPLHRSGEAFRLCASLGLDADAPVPAELVAGLTGRPVAECRRLWQDALVRGEGASVAADVRFRPGRSLLVHLHPLTNGCSSGHSTAGVVIQVEDVTGLARDVRIKDDFIERIGFQLNNDFESISGAVDLIGDPRIGAPDRRVLVATLREKVKSAGGMLRSARGHIARPFAPDARIACPVRISPLIEAAVAASTASRAEKAVAVDHEPQAYARLVLAEPRELEAILVAVLRLLARDARPGSRIGISLWQSRGGMVVLLANDGFAMPSDRLRDCLLSGGGDDPDLARIAEGRRRVAGWGGSLTADAGIGEGLRFQVRLRNVL